MLATKEFVRDEMVELRKDFADLREYMAECKTDIIRWMFIFWVGSVVGMLLMFLLLVRR